MAVPLHELKRRCANPRLPALAGAWAVGCGPNGQVDRAVSLLTGERIAIDLPQDAEVALGEGLLYATGAQGGLLALTPSGPEPVETAPRLPGAPSGPPGVSKDTVAAQQPGRVLHGTPNAATVSVHATTPAGWYPITVGDGFLAWVVAGEQTGEDVWMLDLQDPLAEPQPVAATAAHERHAAASGPWLSYVSGDTLVRLHVPTGRRESVTTGTGFSAPPTAWGDVVCWETRSEDVDIACSDGVVREGPAHQRWPSRWERWLLYREGQTVLLYTVP